MTPTRSSAHLAFIRSLPCAVQGCRCHYRRVEAAHTPGSRGMSQKRSDLDTIPLCTQHHEEQHRIGWKQFIATYESGYSRTTEGAAGEAADLAVRYRILVPLSLQRFLGCSSRKCSDTCVADRAHAVPGDSDRRSLQRYSGFEGRMTLRSASESMASRIARPDFNSAN